MLGRNWDAFGARVVVEIGGASTTARERHPFGAGVLERYSAVKTASLGEVNEMAIHALECTVKAHCQSVKTLECIVGVINEAAYMYATTTRLEEPRGRSK